MNLEVMIIDPEANISSKFAFALVLAFLDEVFPLDSPRTFLLLVITFSLVFCFAAFLFAQSVPASIERQHLHHSQRGPRARFPARKACTFL